MSDACLFCGRSQSEVETMFVGPPPISFCASCMTAAAEAEVDKTGKSCIICRRAAHGDGERIIRRFRDKPVCESCIEEAAVILTET